MNIYKKKVYNVKKKLDGILNLNKDNFQKSIQDMDKYFSEQFSISKERIKNCSENLKKYSDIADISIYENRFTDIYTDIIMIIEFGKKNKNSYKNILKEIRKDINVYY